MVEQEELGRLGEAARTLAHEIRNPLSAIRLHAGILRKTASPDGSREAALIDEEVARLTLLSDRIGTFLRDPRGSPQPVGILAFVQELLLRFSSPVILDAGPDAEHASILFDPERLRSVIENLITNAIESGSREDPRVTIAACRTRVEVAVLDRGAGIATNDAEHVFDPFFTRKVKGTGVGLAIARRFAEAADAVLDLQPRPGGGTRARLVCKRIAQSVAPVSGAGTALCSANDATQGVER